MAQQTPAPLPTTQHPSGNKRKADEVPSEDYDEESEGDKDMEVKWNCDQVNSLGSSVTYMYFNILLRKSRL